MSKLFGLLHTPIEGVYSRNAWEIDLELKGNESTAFLTAVCTETQSLAVAVHNLLNLFILSSDTESHLRAFDDQGQAYSGQDE